jgi:hypothetical protein
MLVYIIKYSNRSILNELRRLFPPNSIPRESILAAKNNSYVENVSYHDLIDSGMHVELSF